MRKINGLSVIMPCYNAGSYLEEAVESVLAQDFDLAPYELIIVDDKSNDPATLEILDRYADYGPPVRVIRQDDNDKKGPSAARNKGIQNARYSHIVPVDADDKLVTGNPDGGYLHQVYRQFRDEPDTDIVYSKLRLTGALEAPFHVAPYQERLMLITNLLHVFGAFPKQLADDMGGYDEDVWGTEDYLFWVSMINHVHKSGGKAKVHLIDDELYLYRQHEHELNVDASHGKSYREMMETITAQNPEIYASYFPKVPQQELPGFLERQMRAIIKRHPYRGAPDAEAWFHAYIKRLKLTDEQAVAQSKDVSTPRSLLRTLAKLQDSPVAAIRAATVDRGRKTASYKLGQRRVHLLADPEIAHDAVTKPEVFQKPELMRQGLNFFGGEGIFAARFEVWKQQRSNYAPHFNAKANTSHFPEMVRIIDEELQNLQDGDEIVPYDFCRRFALRIFCKSLLGVDITADKIERISRGMDAANERMFDLLTDADFLSHDEIKPSSRKLQRQVIPIIRFIHQVVEDRMASPVNADDGDHSLLDGIIAAVTAQETDTAQAKAQIKEEVYHLLLAGHETTGATTAWCLYHLAHDLETQDALRAETTVVYDRDNQYVNEPRPNDIPLMQKVLRETLRLHPSPYVSFPRIATEDYEAGDLRIKEGDLAFVCIDAIHQDPRFYKEPQSFRPDHFSPEEIEQRPSAAFMPFLTGPHFCLGSMMSIRETFLSVSMLLQHFKLTPVTQDFPAAANSLTAAPQAVPLRLQAVR